jgi:hypothetical protein
LVPKWCEGDPDVHQDAPHPTDRRQDEDHPTVSFHVVPAQIGNARFRELDAARVRGAHNWLRNRSRRQTQPPRSPDPLLSRVAPPPAPQTASQ